MKLSVLFAGWLVLACFCGHGQVHPTFQNLNFAQCNSDFFWSQTFYLKAPPNGSAYTDESFESAITYLNGMSLASLGTSQVQFPTIEEIYDARRLSLDAEQVIPLVIMDVSYDVISPLAVQEGWVYAEGDLLWQADEEAEIFESHHATCLLVGSKKVGRGTHRFRLRSQDLLAEEPGSIDEIRIDFGDGAGWRSVETDEIIEVFYNEAVADRLIRMVIERDGDVKMASYKSFEFPCVSEYDQPVLEIPWETDSDPDYPWRISVQEGGYTVMGNAYFLPAGEFDKPFIFVEGVDFSYDHLQDRNGDFGWCEFTSGISDPNFDYAMLHRMPELLDEVRSRGYDIILLDFYDGAGWIQRNSALLQDLIQKVNAAKTGTEPIILAGASMGGQITRHALATMELAGIDHCTRLWISLDSPHKGAYIPLSLQQALYALSEQEGAQDFIYNYLNRPAARQMLNVQYHGEPLNLDFYFPDSRNAWYEELDGLPFPSNCRTVGIANGNMNGSPIYATSDPTIMDFSCELTDALSGPEFEFVLFTSEGHPDYITPDLQILGLDDILNVCSVVNITRPSVTDYLGYLGTAWNAGFSAHVFDEAYTVVGTPNYDFAPGGKRLSWRDFVRSLNRSVMITGTNCNPITEYVPAHSFIGTASALAIDVQDVYSPLNDDILGGVLFSPFDRVHGPLAGNEYHSEITDGNLAFILQEILGGENADGTPLIPAELDAGAPNGGDFNYGKDYFHDLRTTTISGGAHLSINADGPVHYGETIPDEDRKNHFVVHTFSGCAASEVRIGQMGLLSVGDADGSRTGELQLRSGSELTIETAGQCIIYPGSRIRIEKGAVLRVESGASFQCLGGELVVEEGASLIYNGGSVILEGEDARIALMGGSLHVAPNTTFAPQHPNGTAGYLEFGTEADQDVFCGSGSKILLTGDGPENTILRITDWANLWNGNFGQGHLELQNGRVDLHNNGQLWTDMRLTATNVHFADDASAAGYSTIQSWYNYCTFTNCVLSQTALLGNYSRITINGGSMNGEHSGMDVRYGYYRVDGTHFTDCGIHSESLDHPSLLENALFTEESGYSNGGIVVSDESIVKLTVRKSHISQADLAIEKEGGELTLRCNTLINNGTALSARKGCLVNMSAQAYGGYNILRNNGNNIELEHAGGLNLAKGYNELSSYSGFNIIGSIAGIPCPNDCSAPVLDATANTWTANGTTAFPDPAGFAVESGSFSLPCSSPPVYFYCPVNVVDPLPQPATPCGSRDGGVQLVKPQKSMTVVAGASKAPKGETGLFTKSEEDEDPGNPVLSTPSFVGLTLDSALVLAAMQMEIYDSTANDLVAMDLFHEILTSGLDRTNPDIRWKMAWGRANMKSSMEQLFLDGGLAAENNTAVFEAPVQQYVDVLNLMTDTVLSDSTYRGQFYLELDKGQLFRTINMPAIAREVFIHLGDCQLDLPEQEVLNNWRYQVDEELGYFTQYVEEGVSPDAMNVTVDTTAYTSPIEYISGEYYFGLWIGGPDDLTFVECGGNHFKLGTMEGTSFRVYPNPAHDELVIVASGEASKQTLELVDTLGRSVLKANAVIGTAGWRWALPALPAGTYVLKIGDPPVRKTVIIR